MAGQMNQQLMQQLQSNPQLLQAVQQNPSIMQQGIPSNDLIAQIQRQGLGRFPQAVQQSPYTTPYSMNTVPSYNWQQMWQGGSPQGALGAAPAPTGGAPVGGGSIPGKGPVVPTAAPMSNSDRIRARMKARGAQSR